MKIKYIIILSTLAVLAACTPEQDTLLGSVSDPSMELMSHDFRYIGQYKGWCYGAYNAGYNSTKEHPRNLDIDLKLTKWRPDDPEDKTFFQVAKAGEGKTDMFRPPYDPTGFIEGSKLYCMYCPSIDSTATYVCRVFDLENETFDGPEQVMTLDGMPMTVWNVLDIYNSKSPVVCNWILDGGPEQAYGLGMNVEIVKKDDCYYSCLSEVGGIFSAIVIRSDNLTDWVTAGIPDFSGLLKGKAFWEGVVHPLGGSLFAFATRIQSEDGAVFGLWNSETGEFSNLQLIPDAITARPEFFEFNGETYLAANIYGPSSAEGYGAVYRSTCAFFRINREDWSLEQVKTKQVVEGIHYFTFYNYRHDLYMVYSTDARRLDAGEARSNIAVERIFLKK